MQIDTVCTCMLRGHIDVEGARGVCVRVEGKASRICVKGA
jgi:hypothetical protein